MPISDGHNEAGVHSGSNYQQLYIPVLVASPPNQDMDPKPAAEIFANAPGTPATTPTVDIAINGTEEKASNAKLTIIQVKPTFEHKNSSIQVKTIEVNPSPPLIPTTQASPKLYREELLSSATRLKKRIEETDGLIVWPGV